MGIVCLCGVRVGLDGVAAVRMNQEVTFTGETGTRSGTLTYTADVCNLDLATSFVTITFDQTSDETPDRSFTETSTSITSVVCNQEGVNCEITVMGTMMVNNVTRNFVAVFRDNAMGTDNVQSFVITGFFSQQGAAPVEGGSIVNQGCQEV
ncbi:hypothetical protein [Bacillus sp. 7884-1]|uniref:hypothetical protein n=1 Tax=Bacillus sp. 7884-1 TaxID=2021693 RepID=UPI000BA5FA8C|nr:hypothetical protein [Bacillus sp. 7884-1]PAE42893.1 hypothetical protein CHI06_09600 [Bacillus sp. 7884-1]